PLYISFFLGVITSLFGVALMVYAVLTKVLGIAAPGASGVLIALALFSGVILTTNGIVGIYLARIYYEVKNRPKYIISRIFEQKKEVGQEGRGKSGAPDNTQPFATGSHSPVPPTFPAPPRPRNPPPSGAASGRSRGRIKKRFIKKKKTAGGENRVKGQSQTAS